MIPWAFITVISIMLFSGTAHHHINQPNKVITAALGNTVTLQCYADREKIFWYKQIARQQPRIISAFLKWNEPTFYNEFKNDRFWGKRLGSNSNITISGITQSDEAVYYCASVALYIEFGSGTHLIIKGPQNSASKNSTSDLLDYMECQQKCSENSTKQVNTEEKLFPAVLGLACALGICGVLVFALMGFIFRRVQGSGQDNQDRGQSKAQDPDDENLTYAALRFSRKKMKSGGKREQSHQTMRVHI